jgi:hypothetical protein
MDSQETRSDIIAPDQAPGRPSAPERYLRKIFAALALAAAGCGNLPDAQNQAQLLEENKKLKDDLAHCINLSDMQGGGILSEGTLGVKRMYFDRENRFVLPKTLAQIDQVFMLWPQPQAAEGLTLEGDPKKLSAIKIGSTWGAQFKADYTQGEPSKDAFVIQAAIMGFKEELDPMDSRVKRYVIIIERK